MLVAANGALACHSRFQQPASDNSQRQTAPCP
jgi:hypothetical protein